MKIGYSKYVNTYKDGIVEFNLNNFDYIDGNKFLAKIFCDTFGMAQNDEEDGVWFSRIKVHNDDCGYYFVWHEDAGNYVYSENSSPEQVRELEEKLSKVIEIINSGAVTYPIKK